MVGRDIGTAIMPQADLKIYLEASPEVRAERRYKEMVARGEEASYEEILADMRRRDEIDSHRSVAPLRPAPDAHMVNTDDLSIEEAMNRVMRLVKDWTP
jgi:cytidylate kinase